MFKTVGRVLTLLFSICTVLSADTWRKTRGSVWHAYKRLSETITQVSAAKAASSSLMLTENLTNPVVNFNHSWERSLIMEGSVTMNSTEVS